MASPHDRFLERLVTFAGRAVAAAAVNDGRRHALNWVQDAFLLGILDGLSERGVPRRTAADMFGTTRRTLQRQESAARERVQQRRRSVWMRILDHLRENGPQPREVVVGSIRGADTPVVASVVQQMVEAGWITERGDRLSARPKVELADEEVIALLKAEVHASTDPSFDVEHFSREYGIEVERIRSVLEAAPNALWLATGRGPARWLALGHLLHHVERYLMAKLEGDESACMGNAWTLRLVGHPGAEAAIRERVEHARQVVRSATADLSDPTEVFDENERHWSAVLFETVR